MKNRRPVFFDAAVARLNSNQLDPDSPERLILKLLLEEAVGWRNAMPWSLIRQPLLSRGFNFRKGAFQQGLLRVTRHEDDAIGSCQDGFFIVGSEADANVSNYFNWKRVQEQNRNGRHFRELMKIAGFEIWTPDRVRLETSSDRTGEPAA